MEGAVIVGAVRQDDGQAVGFVPRANKMIRRRLGGRIRTSGIIGRIFGKLAAGTEGSKDLVSGNVMKAEVLGAPPPMSIGTAGLKQGEGAGHVGFDEIRWSVNRPIHMAFRRKMHHCVG